MSLLQKKERGKMVFKIRKLFGADKTAEDKNNEQEFVPDSVEEATESFEEVAPQTLEVTDPEIPAEEIIEACVTATAAPALEDDEEEEEKAPPRRERFKPRNVEELLLTAIPERANNATPNLKAILSKKILIELIPSGKKYLFDPTNANDVTVTVSGTTEASCTLQLHEKDLMKISEGNLNPQVLMLSHKAKVSGDAQVATHFFTLIAPYSNI